MYKECLDHVRAYYPQMTRGLTDLLKHASTHQESYINELEASGNNALEPLILDSFPELERPPERIYSVLDQYSGTWIATISESLISRAISKAFI